MNQQCQQLICLVGSNPLPNYIAVRQLQPESVLLYHTAEDAERLDSSSRVADVLAAALKQFRPQKFDISATDAPEIARKLGQRHLAGAWLNYTGGTKVMAVHAYAAFRKLNETAGPRAFYVDDRGSGSLRFTDGEVRPLSVDLTFEEFWALHNVRPRREKTAAGDSPTLADAEALAGRIFADGPGLAHELYCQHHNEKARAKISLAEIGFGDRTVQYGDPSWDSWRRFITGVWLEHWCSSLFDMPTRVGSKLVFNDREMELDVLAIRHHRLLLLSCTTGAKIGECKLKAFEAYHRARQLGGDHARSALACFLSDADRDLLKREMRLPLGGPETLAVFGLNDLRNWYQGHRDSLHAWLRES